VETAWPRWHFTDSPLGMPVPSAPTQLANEFSEGLALGIALLMPFELWLSEVVVNLYPQSPRWILMLAIHTPQ
jgi:hypothetical protein